MTEKNKTKLNSRNTRQQKSSNQSFDSGMQTTCLTGYWFIFTPPRRRLLRLLHPSVGLQKWDFKVSWIQVDQQTPWEWKRFFCNIHAVFCVFILEARRRISFNLKFLNRKQMKEKCHSSAKGRSLQSSLLCVKEMLDSIFWPFLFFFSKTLENMRCVPVQEVAHHGHFKGLFKCYKVLKSFWANSKGKIVINCCFECSKEQMTKNTHI